MIKLHDFTKGKTAQFLSKVRKLTFEIFRNVELIKIDGIKYDPSKIEIDENGFAVYKNGEERMLLFYYKQFFYTNWTGSRKLPKYHIVHCETRQEYGGFVFANKMPVKVTSRENQQTTLEKLELCKNCSKQVFKSWWGTNQPWFEAVLKYIEHQNTPLFKSDGYHSMWNQISEAYRESVGFKCESCRIDLSNQDDKKWLHTHHKNGNTKDNRASNFQALCLLCHSLSHKEKLTKGTGFLEVQDFIDSYKNRLNQTQLSEYEQIKRNTGHNSRLA